MPEIPGRFGVSRARGLLDARSTLQKLRHESAARAAQLGETVIDGPASLDELQERLRSLGYVD